MMHMITKAKKRDGPEIRKLTASAGVFKPAEVACVSELWDDYRRHGSESGYDFVVFRDGAESVLGYACYGHHPLTEDTFDLYWIVVHPEARGRGIARSLLEHVENQVVRQGGRLLVLETSSSDAYAPARRLYASRGYAREATFLDFYAPGDDLLIYAKSLSSQDGDALPHRAALREHGASQQIGVHQEWTTCREGAWTS
jgi:ribosomal protein S18 acetylase RimI-like enzyme